MKFNIFYIESDVFYVFFFLKLICVYVCVVLEDNLYELVLGIKFRLLGWW